jgi:hypothetical protein
MNQLGNGHAQPPVARYVASAPWQAPWRQVRRLRSRAHSPAVPRRHAIVAALPAYSKAAAGGRYKPRQEAETLGRCKAKHGGTMQVDLLHRTVPTVETPQGLRASGKERTISPEFVERYLQPKPSSYLGDTKVAMASLARSIPARRLVRCAFPLSEGFHLAIPPCRWLWGDR